MVLKNTTSNLLVTNSFSPTLSDFPASLSQSVPRLGHSYSKDIRSTGLMKSPSGKIPWYVTVLQEKVGICALKNMSNEKKERMGERGNIQSALLEPGCSMSGWWESHHNGTGWPLASLPWGSLTPFCCDPESAGGRAEQQ